MAGPDNYYDDDEADSFPEQCTGCDQYVELDSPDGLCPECREDRMEG